MPHNPSLGPQPHDEPPSFEEPLTSYLGSPLQAPPAPKTPYPSTKYRIPWRSFRPKYSPVRRQLQRPRVRQQPRRTSPSGARFIGIALIVMLAIIAALTSKQDLMLPPANTSMYDTYSTNDTLPTVRPTPTLHISSQDIEQRSLLLAHTSGASGNYLSSYYDSGSGSIAITETIGQAQIDERTVLTNCFDIEKAVWQGKLPSLKTVTVNIIFPVDNGGTSPIAICTLNKSTEQQFAWDILTPEQAWMEYDYRWILPSMLQE